MVIKNKVFIFAISFTVECNKVNKNVFIKLMQGVKKNRFREIYDSLPARQEVAPKTDWVNEIAKITKSHPTTVRAWIYGAQKPDALKTSIISKHLGIPEDELFN